jgi:hypothetical protein
MPETKSNSKKPAPAPVAAAAPAATASTTTTFAAVMEKAPGKDRANLQRHLDELNGEHAKTWRGLVAVLGGLAPHGLQTVGRESIRFFVADGRYRFQLFALEDSGDGQLRVYLPNVVEEAIKRKLLVQTPVPGEYAARGAARGPTLRVEELDANNTTDAPPHFKYMIGLNRKALRVTVPAVGGASQVDLVAALCGLAAKSHAAAEAANAPAK